MSLLSSLPGDIPGLLRRCSPLVFVGLPDLGIERGTRGVLDAISGDGKRLCVDAFPDLVGLHEVVLDLTDPTGRAHAAAWVLSQRATTSSIDEAEALRLALVWSDMTPAQIDTLARLVLRLAGRTP